MVRSGARKLLFRAIWPTDGNFRRRRFAAQTKVQSRVVMRDEAGLAQDNIRLPQLRGFAVDDTRLGRRQKSQRQVCALTLRPDHAYASRQQFAHIHGNRHEVELTRFAFHQIKHAVDDFQQVLAILAWPVGFALTNLVALAVWIVPFTLALAARILSPYEAVLAGRFVVQATARLHRVHPTIVAITGSYGKTSTKNHLADLLGGDGGVVVSSGIFV